MLNNKVVDRCMVGHVVKGWIQPLRAPPWLVNDKPILLYLVAFSREIASYMAGDSVGNLLHLVILRLIVKFRELYSAAGAKMV